MTSDFFFIFWPPLLSELYILFVRGIFWPPPAPSVRTSDMEAPLPGHYMASYQLSACSRRRGFLQCLKGENCKRGLMTLEGSDHGMIRHSFGGTTIRALNLCLSRKHSMDLDKSMSYNWTHGTNRSGNPPRHSRWIIQMDFSIYSYCLVSLLLYLSTLLGRGRQLAKLGLFS